VANLLTEAGENFKAYGVAGHRHLPEIEQGLATLAGGSVSLTFVPHLVPMNRGIHSTLFGRLLKADQDLHALFSERYANEPFIDVLPVDKTPETGHVRGGNRCQIGVSVPQDRNTVVVTVAIDNLVKGASGQAVQVMNLMFGLPETAGLAGIALAP